MRAGWMRPSAMRLAIACRATSRRNGSKEERMLAPGGGRGEVLLRVRDGGVARAEVLLERIARGEAIGERARLVGEDLLETDHLLLPRPRPGFGVGNQRVRFLARLELGFLLEGF